MKDRRQTTKTPARTLIGAVVSSCLVALFAVFICFSLLPQSPASMEPNSEQQASEEAIEQQPDKSDSTHADGNSPYEIGSAGAEYEKSKVLLRIDGDTEAESVNAILADCEFAATKDVADQDLNAGFVEVELEPGITVETAVIRLQGAGLKAQPNYIFHAAENADEEKASLPLLVNPLSDDSIETQAVEINDASRTSQWMLDSIDAYKAWGIQKAGDSGVSVAVIDTGALTSHPDLKDNIKQDAYNSAEEISGLTNVQDAMSHGTHVAGIASARTNNGTGVAGVSYNAGLVIIKASMKNEAGVETQDFNTATLARGITWLLDESNGTSIAQKHNVKVINMSVGGAGTVSTSDVLYKKITEARGKGILTVCAAGNSTNGTVPYSVIPGDYKDCLSVISLQHSTSGSTNDAGGVFNVSRLASSNYNTSSATENSDSAKNISAPGQDIFSTMPNGSYDNKSGTSMASPCVAGVAALIYANKPSLSAENVQKLLCATATDINTKGWDRETGYGEVSPYRALQITSATIAVNKLAYMEETPLALKASDGSSVGIAGWEWKTSNSNVIAIDEKTGVMKAVGAGTATITATYTKSGGISTSKVIAVNAFDLKNVTISGIAPQTYSGSPIQPALSVSYNGKTLKAGTDYAVSYANNTNVGTATVTLSKGTGNGCTGSKSTSFVIKQADLADATIDEVAPRCYTGGTITPQPVVKLNGKQIPNTDYTLSYANNIETGRDTALITITGRNVNLTGSKAVRFSITTNDLNEASVSAISAMTYTGSALMPKPAVTLGDVRLKEGENFTYSYVSNINVGTATLTIKGAKGYEGVITRTFRIEAANIANATVASVPSQYYTGSAITPKPAVTYQGKTLTAGKDFTYQYVKNTNTGTAQILINAAGSNFTGYKIVNFTIVKKPTSSQGSSSSSSAAKPSSSSGTSTSSASANKTSDRWEKVGTKWRYMYGTAKQKSTGKKYPKNEFLTINGTRYHFDSSGYMHTGWQTISGSKYYFTSSGAMSKNWLKLNSTWYYMGSDGKMRKGWQTISGSKYYFKSSGVMTTGWQKLSGKWYYMGSDGKMRKGWQTISKTKYYFKSNGSMATGWQTISGSKYYFRSSGTMATGWLKLSGKWYYLNSSGKMLTGWQTISKVKYYFKSNGVMATGWQKISGKWSYFKSSGSMSKGWQKIGGVWYHLGTDGKMLTGWKKDGKTWYYLKSSGAMATGWQKVGGKWYYLKASGAMVSSKWVGNYWVGSNGVMATSAWVDSGRYYVGADGAWIPGKRR